MKMHMNLYFRRRTIELRQIKIIQYVVYFSCTLKINRATLKNAISSKRPLIAMTINETRLSINKTAVIAIQVGPN